MKAIAALEMHRIADVLDKIETETYRNTGLGKINGGFAIAEMTGFGAKHFDVRLQFGIQDGDEDQVATERFKVSRKTRKRMED